MGKKKKIVHTREGRVGREGSHSKAAAVAEVGGMYEKNTYIIRENRNSFKSKNHSMVLQRDAI